MIPRCRGKGGAAPGVARRSARVFRCPLALAMVASSLGSGLQAQQPADRVHGAQVRVLQLQAPDLRGELLALEEDQRLWVRSRNDEFLAVPLNSVREVRVQRHNWSTTRIARWTLIGGGITSGAMFGACMSVEGNEVGECGLFTLVWGGAWAAVGTVSRLLVRPTRTIRRAAIEEVRQYARFPQGLPPGYPPARSTAAPSAGEDL
jgi:hypothetical protein